MKNLIPYLTKAVAKPGYKLYLEYEDATKGTVDLSKWVGKGVFEYWNKEENFTSFTITADKKLQWNEDIDMEPDAFYLQLIGKTFDEYAGDKQLLWDSHKMYFGDHHPPHFSCGIRRVFCPNIYY